MTSDIFIGSIIVGYNLFNDDIEKSYIAKQKYGIVTGVTNKTQKAYTVKWADGDISSHELWEMEVLREHSSLVFNNGFSHA